jgi:hypothetical protein
MQYKHFWQHWVQQHATDRGGWTLNPGAAFAALLCLFLLSCWVAHQTQSRCSECEQWPVRCRCGRH